MEKKKVVNEKEILLAKMNTKREIHLIFTSSVFLFFLFQIYIFGFLVTDWFFLL